MNVKLKARIPIKAMNVMNPSACLEMCALNCPVHLIFDLHSGHTKFSSDSFTMHV